MDNLEIEAKFWLPTLLGFRQRILAQGASLTSSRHLERNLRFDTHDRILSTRSEVLRIRQADRITLTFKRPVESYEVRQEWEIEVDNFEIARVILEGLGYEMIHCYEKYREIFKLNHCLVMLDEVPYGCFTEIEGPDLEMIQSTCTQLQLNWEARIQHTYLDMFQALSDGMEPKPTDATFEAFAEHPEVDATLLNLPSGYLPSDEEVHQA